MQVQELIDYWTGEVLTAVLHKMIAEANAPMWLCWVRGADDRIYINL